MKKVKVVAGVIVYKDEILCVQRPESHLSYVSKKFEFPGGKIEEGESEKEALERELIEELDMRPAIKELYLTVEHQYPDFHLTMHSYLCETHSKDLKLAEHLSAQWLTKDQLGLLDWADADVPIVKKLMLGE